MNLATSRLLAASRLTNGESSGRARGSLPSARGSPYWSLKRVRKRSLTPIEWLGCAASG